MLPGEDARMLDRDALVAVEDDEDEEVIEDVEEAIVMGSLPAPAPPPPPPLGVTRAETEEEVEESNMMREERLRRKRERVSVTGSSSDNDNLESHTNLSSSSSLLLMSSCTALNLSFKDAATMAVVVVVEVTTMGTPRRCALPRNMVTSPRSGAPASKSGVDSQSMSGDDSHGSRKPPAPLIADDDVESKGRSAVEAAALLLVETLDGDIKQASGMQHMKRRRRLSNTGNSANVPNTNSAIRAFSSKIADHVTASPVRINLSSVAPACVKNTVDGKMPTVVVHRYVEYGMRNRAGVKLAKKNGTPGKRRMASK